MQFISILRKPGLLVKNIPAPGMILGIFLLCTQCRARADDFVVYSPYVVKGQSEMEFRGYGFKDSSNTLNGVRGYAFSIAHSFTDWWKPEIYLGQYQRQSGQGTDLQAYEFENTFQLTDTGKYWADLGFLASYEYATRPGEVSNLEFGPLFEKRTGRFVHTLNLIWEKQIGGGAGSLYEFRAAYSLGYQLRSWFAPGGEIYIRPHDNAYQMGPVLYGELVTAGGNELEYSASIVQGLNPGAPDQTFILRLEYEFY